MEIDAFAHRIKSLEKEAKKLELTAGQRSEYMEQLKHFSNTYLDELPQIEAYNDRQPDLKRIAIHSENHRSMTELLDVFQEDVVDPGLRAASGGHLGYIPGGGVFAGAAGDFLAAVSNEYAGVYYASPGAAAVENEVINWLKKVFSFPESAVGNLASGGSISSMTALTAARDKYGIKNEKIPNAVVYMSNQAHHCLTKALKIIGLEDVQIRLIDLDERYRMKPDHLVQCIEEDRKNGRQPLLVIATAGTTNVGAVDPLHAIAEICQRYQLWYHVDAAYGGFFITTSKKDLFKGIEKADSLVVDPHKALFLPYGIGAVLIKDAKAVLQSHLASGDYLQDTVIDNLTQNPSNVSPELTKHFRGMRIWLPLQLHGIAPFVANLEEKLLLTQYMLAKLRNLGFKTGPDPDLSVGYFWYPFLEDRNANNKKLMEYIHRDGRVFLSSTLLDGKFVIRIAILSFRTHQDTVDRALDMIVDALENVKSEIK